MTPPTGASGRRCTAVHPSGVQCEKPPGNHRHHVGGQLGEARAWPNERYRQGEHPAVTERLRVEAQMADLVERIRAYNSDNSERNNNVQ